MSRNRRAWNQSIYNKYLREGRGQGIGTDYDSWIHVQDFPSLGMVSRVSGTTTGRIHHLMSNLELSVFYLLDWSDNVLDIREQYPLLDLAQAVEIAERANIKYPYDPESGFPYVLTSDFYLETKLKPIEISSPYGKFKSEIKEENGTIIYVQNVEIFDGKFPASEFEAIKNFYEQIETAQSSKITLRIENPKETKN